MVGCLHDNEASTVCEFVCSQLTVVFGELDSFSRLFFLVLCCSCMGTVASNFSSLVMGGIYYLRVRTVDYHTIPGMVPVIR